MYGLQRGLERGGETANGRGITWVLLGMFAPTSRCSAALLDWLQRVDEEELVGSVECESDNERCYWQGQSPLF